MEPWKLGAIVALLVGVVGFGMFANSDANIGLINPPTKPTPMQIGGQSTPVPPAAFAKYLNGTIPAWPNISQWANTTTPATLASLKGKPALVEVFRINCSHCQDAAPFLVELHKRYAPRGVAFVGLQSPGNFDDALNPENNWTGVQQWLKDQKYTWPVGFDAKSKWFQGKFGDKISYPTLFLLDKTGKVVFIQSGHDDQKALQLAVELERIAPGTGDIKAQSTDLSRFLMPKLNIEPSATGANGENMEQSLSTEIANRLSK